MQGMNKWNTELCKKILSYAGITELKLLTYAGMNKWNTELCKKILSYAEDYWQCVWICNTCTNLIHSEIGTSAILFREPTPSSSSSSSWQFGASHMTQGGVLVVLASVTQGQDDVETVVGVIKGSAVDYLQIVRWAIISLILRLSH